MRFGIYLLAMMILACPAFASKEGVPPAVGDKAPDFTLKDAEDQTYSLKKLRGQVVFLIMGNRKIRKEDDKWAEAFHKDYETHEGITAYIVADMRSVPGSCLRGSSRGNSGKTNRQRRCFSIGKARRIKLIIPIRRNRICI